MDAKTQVILAAYGNRATQVANVTQVSAIKDDQLILRASYGPSPRDRTHRFTVRGRVVHRTKLLEATVRATYRYVQFADTGLWAWVNETNVASAPLNS